MNQDNKGRLVIISGPSGAGKSTVVGRLLDECGLPLRLSVSATTRTPRPGEVDGVSYFFLTPEEFAKRQAAGDFLESKEVFGLGHWYGTLREQVATGLNQGDWVILEIDVQGALTILENEDFDPITLFIHPGGMDELENRLRSRRTETNEAISARLETAAAEMLYRHRYQFEIINGNVDNAVAEICQILNDQKENYPCSKS
ncbi:Guanylate kinase [Rubripirellula amarantea]|uniref:Guanylate kinase n=1 Tax=Rubripirellula amarantea TaxID=2527999 RepID=A0A5C5WTU8_9BACT|nr:guanylate kinase [Rubripirellula amarantea]TWT53619.1 Guanylate kinase [Rubripirellula amarantea]